MKFVHLIIAIAFTCVPNILTSQTPLTYYLPEVEYKSDIPSPESYLNYQIGDWHISHDQLYHYMRTLCESSPNCHFEEYGRTHENRPLVNLVISSSENLKNLEEIKAERMKLIDPKLGQVSNLKDLPIIVYQGYSVHGNESSGANSSTLVAYYLLAGQSEYLEKLLETAVIIIDPCYNPDGLQRFSTWANMHKHHSLSSDPNGREFNEVWPGGRTNHYWFDLNRDWLFTIHPSSQGRISNFHRWKPDILTDHHEMGSNSTFFFQPGIPSRTNPNTPQINQDLTEQIGTFHASFLDSLGSLYYSKENFDDYYYGKGSTYPDINGCIGILFEQASSRGHLRETDNGLLSFPFTIRNQVVTSLSTQRAAFEMRDKILEFKKDFYAPARQSKGSFVFECDDHYKVKYFVEMLNRHQIDVYKLDEKISIESHNYNPETSYVVPRSQPQSALIKTIFERVHEFNDSLFYDVSTWTLPLALNIPSAYTTRTVTRGAQVKEIKFIQQKMSTDNVFAYAIDWSQYNAPTLLYQLLKDGLKVRVAKEALTAFSNKERRVLNKGSLIIPLSNQPVDRDEVIKKIFEYGNLYQVNLLSIDTGQTSEGKSLGGPQQQILDIPKVAMIVGEGVNSYEAGATWHQFDQRLRMPVTMIDIRQLSRRSLDDYNVIIMPDGRYQKEALPTKKIESWIKSGGTLIAFRKAINLTNKLNWTNMAQKREDTRSKAKVVYENLQQSSGAQVIGGAIFETEINLAHPLFYGYKTNRLPIFKRGTQFYEVSKFEIATPMKYTENPLLSGYTSNRNKAFASNAAALTCTRIGSGKVIAMVDNPNFRGYWLGGSQLFANMIFFNGLIANGALESISEKP